MPENSWSEIDRWAWEEIRAGRVADFNAREGRQERPLDPRTRDDWGDGRRRLSAGFLKEILLREPYRAEVPVEGVRIAGACFAEPVDLGSGRLEQQLWLDKSRFEAAADLTGLRVDGWLSLAGSVFAARNATTVAINLTGARVDGGLNLEGATVAGALTMNGVSVGQHLLMGADDTFKAEFQNVDLAGAEIDGQLVLDGTTVSGTLTMAGLTVERDLFMRGATLTGRVTLIFARIGASLDLSDSELTEVDLSGTRIAGELRLGSAHRPSSRWRGSASLNLRNVRAGALQDRRKRFTDPESGRERWEDAWPDELQLDGFTYDRLGGFGGAAGGGTQGDGSDVDMLVRDVGWYIGWLARDRSYTPQPYEQLAAVFGKAGEPTKATRILYASRECERKEALKRGDNPRATGLSLLKWTIGYGLGLGFLLRPLGWVIAFTAIGAVVLYFSDQPNQGLAAGLPARLVYSLDQLLPIVEFETYDQVVLTGGVAGYLYVQKMIGWLLGSFLVAGLAGLTQK